MLFVPVLWGAGTITSGETYFVPDDYPTIQAAIDAVGHGDEVIVRPGTYFENVRFKGKAITVLSEHGPAVTTIDGGQSGSVVLFVVGEDRESIIEGFTITNGVGSPDGLGATYGGGVLCWRSSPTIRGNVIAGNASDCINGAGIACIDSCPTITENTITGNTAAGDPYGAGGKGSGIYCLRSAAKIIENMITANPDFPGTARGGGVFCEGSPAAEIIGNAITENAAMMGGGIYCLQSSPMIEGNDVSNNVVGAWHVGGGAGIMCGAFSSPTISENTVCGNWSSFGHGGGIHCDGYSSPEVLNCLLADNWTYLDGGGMWIGANSSPTLDGNTIAGNEARQVGGGIACGEYGPSPTVSNSILWGNAATYGPEIYVSGGYGSPTLSIGHSDVAGGQTAVVVGTGGILNWGPGMLDADPLFVDLSTSDFHLSQDPCQPGVVNPCVDAGDPGTTMGLGTTRTDGVPDSGVVDMGYHYPVAYASVTFRNAGTNPSSYTATTLPVLGTGYVATVDLAGTTGHALAIFAGYSSPFTFLLGAGQTGLVDTRGAEYLGFPSSNGPIATVTIPIPSDPAYAGFRVYTQAAHVGGMQPFVLSNAQDLMLGYL